MPHSDPHRASVSLRLSGAQLEAAREHLVGFIEERAAAADAERAVVALDGSVGSALTASLAVEALGTDAVRGLVMDGSATADGRDTAADGQAAGGSDTATGGAGDAVRVARRLGIDFDVPDVDPVVDAVLAGYPDARDDAPAVATVRARLRAVLASLVADHEGGLVLGTADRTAVLLGDDPGGGAGAVDCLPLATLYGQQVRQLARHVGVPDDVVGMTPTAQRRPDRDLGLEGDALDAVLALSVDRADPAVVSIRGARPTAAIVAFDTDEPLSVAETAQLVGVDERAVERVRRAHATSERDRRPPAVPEPSFRG